MINFKKNNFFAILLFTICIVNCVPIDDPKHAQVLRYENDNVGLNGYNYVYETSNGIAAQERAELKTVDANREALSVHGSISWVAADGQQFTLNYIADEKGFRPEGAHLPKA